MKAKYLGFLVPVFFLGCAKNDKSSSPTAGVAEQQIMNLTSDQQAMFTRLQTLNNNEISAGQMAASKACSAEVKQYGQTLVNDHTASNQQLTQIMQDIANSNANNGGANGSGNGSDNGNGGTSAGGNSSGSAGANNGGSSSSGSNGSASNGSSNGGSSNGGSASAAEAGDNSAFTAQQQQSLQEQQAEMTRLQGLSDCSFDKAFLQEMVVVHQFALQDIQMEENAAQSGTPLSDFLKTSMDQVQGHLTMARDLENTLNNQPSPTPSPSPSTSPTPTPTPSATPANGNGQGQGQGQTQDQTGQKGGQGQNQNQGQKNSSSK